MSTNEMPILLIEQFEKVILIIYDMTGKNVAILKGAERVAATDMEIVR